MTKIDKITVAVGRYDRTEALFDGRIGIPGVDATFIDPPTEEMFSRAFGQGEFHVSELSFSNFLRLSVVGKCPYVGIPIFPSRSFRHGTIYVKPDSKITRPKQLEGLRVGVREYSMTAALAARGALRDQYGVDTASINWVMGDVDHHERERIELPALHKKVSIRIAPTRRLLVDMLAEGELDAILAYKRPESSSGLRVLIENHEHAEQEYFGRERIFPIMHLLGIRQDMARASPSLPSAVFKAFDAAQTVALENLRSQSVARIALPWIGAEVKRTTAIMGDDYWPSGLERNRRVLERMISWSVEDGLIPEPVDVDGLFCEGVRQT